MSWLSKLNPFRTLTPEEQAEKDRRAASNAARKERGSEAPAPGITFNSTGSNDPSRRLQVSNSAPDPSGRTGPLMLQPLRGGKRRKTKRRKSRKSRK